jgi:hypothetical protein
MCWKSIRKACLFLVLSSPAFLVAQTLSLSNATTSAHFDSLGLVAIEDHQAGSRVDLAHDGWSITVDDKTMLSEDTKPTIHKSDAGDLVFCYEWAGYQIDVTYKLKGDWNFISKRIRIARSPKARFTVRSVVLWDLTLKNTVKSDFIPSTYIPQLGQTIEQSRALLPGKDFGDFLRFPHNMGLMLTVENPYLKVQREAQSSRISYAPEMEWDQAWGSFESDTGCIGAYKLSGYRLPREMTMEWRPSAAEEAHDGMDRAEVDAFTACVRAFLVNPPAEPISVEVGWTLNDYQIDVGTDAGKTEYQRIIDMTSALGIRTLLYAPGNSLVSDRGQSADTWNWEYVLWLGLGEKIRRGEWDPGKDEIPSSISEMVAYAKQKDVGLLAYVYPSIPFSTNPSWLVQRDQDPERVAATGSAPTYATLASRELQDYLIRNLIAFQKRTGIAGYSFDYTWLDLPGSSSYAQWYGWRRVMQALRKANPGIVIDGRQSYQLYGPWSWLAGSYPHPTGNDEQPESFKPFPDLHFDRVSGDRARFVNYWYRNYQFAPEEIIPGYATHQTERSRNVLDGPRAHPEMMYSRYRPRDWDFLGYQYSFLSSIATGGWNNVVDMIPARDPEEARHFSSQDKAWIRDWLEWTINNKEYLRQTHTILDQPALGHVDGTSAIVDDRGYLFLFNPNYKQMPGRIVLDASIGLKHGERFVLRELYPQKGRLLGKPGAGFWTYGDTVTFQLDGTSATVLELAPADKPDRPVLFNATPLDSSHEPAVKVNGKSLTISLLAGEPGTTRTIGILLPNETPVSTVSVNGNTRAFKRIGNYVEVPLRFAGERFGQAQEIALAQAADGSLSGSFTVPQRILDQLAARRRQWPIPWTREDYESTWLVPERLLLFVHTATPVDSQTVTGTLDNQPLALRPAYTSTRADATCFVGYYADLSAIKPGTRHTIELRLPTMSPGHLQGVFFDNVRPEFTQALAPDDQSVALQ